MTHIEVEASYPVQELGGFKQLKDPATIRKVERLVRRDVGRGIRVQVGKFLDVDSGNLGHANAFYMVTLTGKEAVLIKAAKRAFGYEEDGSMTKVLEFKQVKIVGTSFRAYLDNLPWSFEETVARILTASGQPIFDQRDCCKQSFEAMGKFKGGVFTLYDYKGDKCIHIGGRGSLKVQELKDALQQVLAHANPTPYEAQIHYGQGGTYRWASG